MEDLLLMIWTQFGRFMNIIDWRSYYMTYVANILPILSFLFISWSSIQRKRHFNQYWKTVSESMQLWEKSYGGRGQK